MRREQVHKICLNHALTKEVLYTSKDDKTWLFSVADYSEGEISYQQFCLRFKNAEIASQFMEAVNKSRDGSAVVICATTTTTSFTGESSTICRMFFTPSTTVVVGVCCITVILLLARLRLNNCK